MPAESQNSAGQGSFEETVIMGRPGKDRPAAQPQPPGDETIISKSAYADEMPEQKPAAQTPPSDATIIGKSAYAVEMPAGQEKTTERLGHTPPTPKSIHDQDTVVSPRLKQLAQTPSKPVRPLSGAKAGQLEQRSADGSSSRLIMLVGAVAVLILLVAILVAVLLATRGQALMASLSLSKAPTPTATQPATPVPVFPPTFTPTPFVPTATPIPPTVTPTPRPAPTALAVNVLAKVTPPEGLKLKVREKASTTSVVLGELDKDAQVAILDGPTTADGIRWWKVDNGKGLIGWSAEGLGGDTYLVPVGWAK